MADIGKPVRWHTVVPLRHPVPDTPYVEPALPEKTDPTPIREPEKRPELEPV